MSFKMAECETEIICEPDQKNSKLKSYKQPREKSKCLKFHEYHIIAMEKTVRITSSS